MKSRDTLFRLKQFHVEERRRKLTQIEAMISEFARMAGDLDREIAVEEQRAGISDTAHFAYPTYARAARVRRDNLLRSSEELRDQLEDARAKLENAVEELDKMTSLDGREKGAERGSEMVDRSLSIVDIGLRTARA
jgi:flagellar FliJ protein